MRIGPDRGFRWRLGTLLVLAGGVALFVAEPWGCASPARRVHDRSARVDCARNLQQLGKLLVVSRAIGDWPESSGGGLLLELCLTMEEARREPGCFRCPAAPAADLPDGWRAAYATLDRETLRTGAWPAWMCTYAGRDQRDHPLEEMSDERRPVACDAAAFHEDGVNVLDEDGAVRFLTWRDLGLAGPEEFGFRYGPDGRHGPGPLRALCVR